MTESEKLEYEKKVTEACIEEFKRLKGDRPPRSSMIANISYYKNQAIDRILRDEELLNLIYYTTADALSLPKLTEKQKYSLLFKNIFDTTVADDIIENQKVLITMEYTIVEPIRRRTDYIDGFLTFYVQCHKDIMRTHQGARKDVIAAKIDNIFNGAKGIGMGPLRPKSLVPFWHQKNDWGGYEMSYVVSDFR